MILYHGSNTAIDKPDVLHSREAVDFGAGFYTTPLRAQAAKWCERFKRRGEPAILNEYDFNEDAARAFRILTFDSYSREWLEFVTECRLGKDPKKSDIVIGGVANDKVFNTCELYFRGYLSSNEALDRLKFERPNNQVCFKAQVAIDKCLRFVGSETL